MALNLKPTAEQGNALSHAGKAKRIFPGQRLIYLKTDAVILNGQSYPSIGGTNRNVYASGSRMLGDVVAALLNQPIHNDFRMLREPSQPPQKQPDPDRM